MDYKGIIDWFVEKAKEKQILIILIALLVVLYIDRTKFETKIDFLEQRQLSTDSLYVARLNSVVADFQKEIDACNHDRIQEYIKQSIFYQKKLEDMAKRTDGLYQEIKKLKGQ